MIDCFPAARIGRWLGCVVFMLATSNVAVAQYEFEGPPIRYRQPATANPVARLDERIRAGETRLVPDDRGSLLTSLLLELDIPVSSQALAFSKTSLQQSRISPRTPRAVYFNDDVYVGWIPGALIEIAVMDDELGGVFYTLRDRDPSANLVRDRGSCLGCHASGRTQQVPGFFVRSVPPDEDGRPRDIGLVSDHRSPFESRWGGWYVTGTHGEMRHRGNAFALDPDDEERVDMESGANLVSLEDRFSTTRYLSPHSDLVALLVMEHQTQVQNAITAARYEAIKALDSDRVMNEALERPAEFRTDTTTRRITKAGDRLVDFLLMRDDANFTSPVAGTSTFAEDFVARGPVDSKGRSLRDLDLQTRLFRHRCSYVIHSPAIAALPEPMLGHVRERFLSVLRGEDESGDFDYLSPEERREILEILTETGPEWLGL